MSYTLTLTTEELEALRDQIAETERAKAMHPPVAVTAGPPPRVDGELERELRAGLDRLASLETELAVVRARLTARLEVVARPRGTTPPRGLARSTPPAGQPAAPSPRLILVEDRTPEAEKREERPTLAGLSPTERLAARLARLRAAPPPRG